MEGGGGRGRWEGLVTLFLLKGEVELFFDFF